MKAHSFRSIQSKYSGFFLNSINVFVYGDNNNYKDELTRGKFAFIKNHSNIFIVTYLQEKKYSMLLNDIINIVLT